MSWPKSAFISAAYEELALADYVYSTTLPETTTALFRLESMMASWEVAGIRLGYNMGDHQTVSPDDESGVPDWANEAIYLNLAIRLAAGFGKQITASTATTAKAAYDGLLSLMASNPPQMQFKGNLPIGAGWKRSNYMGGPFVAPPQDLLTTGPDGLLDMEGPVPV